MRQGGDRKSGDARDIQEVDSEVESEPPALDPIPTVGPISVEATESKSVEDDNMSQAMPVSSGNNEPTIPAEPASKVEDTPAPSSPLNAEAVAQRVFSAPLVDVGTQELRLQTESTTSQPERTTHGESAPTVPNVSTASTSERRSASPIKHDEPLASRNAPSIATATAATPSREQPSTKTTVTAGTPSGTSSKHGQKETEGKSEGKVSSWLKTKFARRSSKPAKPTISDPTPVEKPSNRSFIGGANLRGPSDASANRSETADSEREVAMAGETAVPTASGDAENDRDDVSPTAKPRRSLSSSSISSLSSDEDIDDVRGRNRLPREPTPMTHNLKGTLRGQPLQGAAAVDGPEDVGIAPTASGTGRDLRRDSTEEADEEYEEARDTFDNDALPPPRTVGEGTVGRGNDSPARDSKFHEAL